MVIIMEAWRANDLLELEPLYEAQREGERY
jgi:hypothetical protein